MYQPRERLSGERAGLQQQLPFQQYTLFTAASTLLCKCTQLQLHKRTQISQGHRGQSGWAVPSRGVRGVRDAMLTGQDDRSLGYSVVQWSIFILRSAKWGHSGGLSEYIPHLHHESSAAYYSCLAQGAHAFIRSNRLCVRVCMLALQCLSARQLLCTISAQSTEWRHGYSLCDRVQAV